MERNWDTVRAVLSAVEVEDYPEPEFIDYNWKAQPGMDQYLAMLREAGLVRSDEIALTWAGHELLETIRATGRWNLIKDIASKTGVGLTVQTIGIISRSLAMSAIEVQH